MFKRSRIYDIIGAVIATLAATVLIDNFKEVLAFFNYSFQTKISVSLLTLSIVSFISVLITRNILTKSKLRDIASIGEQLTTLQAKLDAQEEIASKDKLTNTYNSNQVDRILSQRITKASERNASFVGLLIDIDNFKRINDTYGHESGNAVLQQVAMIITPRSGEDVLIRYGGDEFLIFSKIGDNKQNGYGLGQRIKKEVSEFEFWIDDKNKTREKMTISCGVTEYNLLQDTQSKFLERLSRALNSAKKNEDGTEKKNFVAMID